MKTCSNCQHELASHEIWATDLGGTLACQACGCRFSPTRENLISIREQREGLCIRGCPTCKGAGTMPDPMVLRLYPSGTGEWVKTCITCGGSGLLNANVQVPTTQAA